MLLLKGCPRCRGDLIVERAEFERVATCLQCGYTAELATIRRLEAERILAGRPAPEREKVRAA
jgi:hypothetical protein